MKNVKEISYIQSGCKYINIDGDNYISFIEQIVKIKDNKISPEMYPPNTEDEILYESRAECFRLINKLNGCYHIKTPLDCISIQEGDYVSTSLSMGPYEIQSVFSFDGLLYIYIKEEDRYYQLRYYPHTLVHIPGTQENKDIMDRIYNLNEIIDKCKSKIKQ